MKKSKLRKRLIKDYILMKGHEQCLEPQFRSSDGSFNCVFITKAEEWADARLMIYGDGQKAQ